MTSYQMTEHAMSRLEERYGLSMCPKQRRRLLERLQAGEGITVHEYGTSDVVEIAVLGKIVQLICDRQAGFVMTILPRKMYGRKEAIAKRTANSHQNKLSRGGRWRRVRRARERRIQAEDE